MAMPSRPQLAAQDSGVGGINVFLSLTGGPVSIALSRSSTRYCAVAVTAALALAGCGSSSSSSRVPARATTNTSTSSDPTASGSTPTSPMATSSTTSSPAGVTSRDGRFLAMIPAGFRNAVASLQGGPINVLYLAVGPRTGGFTTNINVVRESSAGLTDINAVVRDELRGLKRVLPGIRPISSPEPVTVGGEPARVVDYLNGSATPSLHLRQVVVEDRGWIYVVTYTAPSTTYTANLPALAQVISSWHWTSR